MTAPAPGATAASTPYTPVVTDLVRLIKAPFAPGAVYEEQQDQPTFWIPWLLVTVAMLVVSYLLMPFQIRAMELAVAQAGRGAVPSPTGMLIGIVIMLPLTMLAICAVFAGILYALGGTMGAETTYKKMLTVIVFTLPLALLTQLLTWVVLTIRGVDAITSRDDMVVSLGLDNLLPADVQLSGFLKFLLVGVGPLEIWSLVMVAVGLQVLGKLGKSQAWTAAAIFFVVTLLLGAAFKTLGAKLGAG